MCGKMDENISHIVSECNELVQNDTRISGMIKLQHCWTGSGARLIDFRCMRNIMNTLLKRKLQY